MGDLEEDFKEKMSRFGLNFDWFEHPEQLLSKVDNQIDAITNLAEAKGFLKKMNKYYGVVIWLLVHIEIKGR